MGCDGGSIPKRKEIVKSKQKDVDRDKDADRSARWQFCRLSGLKLKRPIVACLLGRLYNKEAIIEHLLSLKQNQKPKEIVKHIRSLKDVKELKLVEKSGQNSTLQATSSTSDKDSIRGQFLCPVSGLEMNGKYKFHFIATCGCVVSERALKEVPDEKHCIVCSKAYDPNMDLIVINGNKEENRELEHKLSLRRQLKKQSSNEKSTSKASESSSKRQGGHDSERSSKKSKLERLR